MRMFHDTFKKTNYGWIVIRAHSVHSGFFLDVPGWLGFYAEIMTTTNVSFYRLLAI